MVDRLGIIKGNPDIDGHVIPEILVSSDHDIAVGILEIEAGSIAFV